MPAKNNKMEQDFSATVDVALPQNEALARVCSCELIHSGPNPAFLTLLVRSKENCQKLSKIFLLSKNKPETVEILLLQHELLQRLCDCALKVSNGRN
jgi:hypothetical protein